MKMISIKNKFITNIKVLMTIVFVLSQYSFGIEQVILFEKPFIVKEVRGQIKSVTGYWPDGYASKDIIFHLIDPNEHGKIWTVKLDNKGNFKINIPDGTYKFEIFVVGWDDAEGTIIVSKNASKKAKIEITLGLS
jgi:hypothetical protein